MSLLPLREELAQITERLASEAVTQEAADRMRLAGTRRLNALTRVLRRKHMKPIARFSETHLSDVVGATEALWLPREEVDAAKLVIAAEAMAEAAAPYAGSFAAKSGLPADFIAQLRAAAQHVSDAIASRHEEKRRRAGANGERTAGHRSRALDRAVAGRDRDAAARGAGRVASGVGAGAEGDGGAVALGRE